jgi:hypothetical protein
MKNDKTILDFKQHIDLVGSVENVMQRLFDIKVKHPNHNVFIVSEGMYESFEYALEFYRAPNEQELEERRLAAEKARARRAIQKELKEKREKDLYERLKKQYG